MLLWLWAQLLWSQAALAGGGAIHELLPWLSSLGVVVEPVVVQDAGLGPGLFSTRAIRQGEVYLNIPYRLAMGPDHALRDPVLAPLLAPLLARARARPQEQLGDCTLTLLQLLHERAKGARSLWRPYIAAMPRAHLAFSECEPSVWMPPGLRRYCDAMVPQHEAEFARLDETPLLETVLRMPGAAFAAERWRAYRWALGMTLSRAQGPIYPNSTRSCWLTPGLDMHNHRLGAHDGRGPIRPMSLDYGAAGLHAGIAAPRPIAGGVEIMTEYHGARKCQHEILLAYGFVPRDEPSRECLPVSAPRDDRLVHFIDAAGTAPPALLRQLAAAPGAAPPGGIDALETAPPMVVFSLLALLQKIARQYGGGGGVGGGGGGGRLSKQRAVRPPTLLSGARCGGLTGAPTHCSTFQTLWASEQRVLQAAIARVEARIKGL